MLSCDFKDSELIIKKSKGRPRKYPVDPITGKTNYKLYDKRISDRIHNKIECPNCFQQVTECNISHHKKTIKCINATKILMDRDNNNN
jgi:hypothetical protein